MKYAVIQLAGKQYFVREGDIIKAQLPRGSSGAVEVREVFLTGSNNDGSDAKIGKPCVKDAVVTLNVTEQKRGRKLRVMKYKAKTRYRKTIGFRALTTTLTVEKIAVGK